ncbi:hypothetical protein [Roseovarius autotrophicus]|uniref:hypothetical protein n=1 Tax=Roseovarius autotrophicus TaxID=2824121 RepID=UPI001B381480|nr:hypothetical protein [Roseovarius autotrophicus]
MAFYRRKSCAGLPISLRSTQAEIAQDEHDDHHEPNYPDDLVHFVQALLNSDHWSLIGSTLIFYLDGTTTWISQVLPSTRNSASWVATHKLARRKKGALG